MSADESTATAFTDGAARGNPGPAGAGACIKLGEDEKHFRKFLGEATNNQAEYEALLLALEESLGLGIRRLQLFADSELMVRQINGQYRVKNLGLKKLYLKARALIEQFEHFEIGHVRREENTVADGLANEAIDQNS